MQTVVQYARMVPPHSDAFHAAVAICHLRGLVPHSIYRGSVDLQNWQAIIAEQLAMTRLQDTLRSQG